MLRIVLHLHRDFIAKAGRGHLLLILRKKIQTESPDLQAASAPLATTAKKGHNLHKLAQSKNTPGITFMQAV